MACLIVLVFEYGNKVCGVMRLGLLFMVAVVACERMKGYVISVGEPVLQGVEWVPAVTSVNVSGLSLRARYTVEYGRRSHFELSNVAMAGCFLSHVNVWRKVAGEGVAVVLEEDAELGEDFWERVEVVAGSIQAWDVIMLTERVWHLASGTKRRVNEYLYECAERRCEWYGTRGYVLSREGARKLLAGLGLLEVQVDAYISLQAMYGGVKMLWVCERLVGQRLWYLSKVWDGCLVCYVSEWVLAAVCVLLLCVVMFGKKRRVILVG